MSVPDSCWLRMTAVAMGRRDMENSSHHLLRQENRLHMVFTLGLKSQSKSARTMRTPPSKKVQESQGEYF